MNDHQQLEKDEKYLEAKFLFQFQKVHKKINDVLFFLEVIQWTNIIFSLKLVGFISYIYK